MLAERHGHSCESKLTKLWQDDEHAKGKGYVTNFLPLRHSLAARGPQRVPGTEVAEAPTHYSDVGVKGRRLVASMGWYELAPG